MRIQNPGLTIFSVSISIACVAVALSVFASSASAQGGGMDDMDMGMMPTLSPLADLKDSLRTAKTDANRNTILSKINAELSQQYDTFLQENESDLQLMERRVKKLRTQLERRKSAKSQLLQLELQRISNEAAGLVWPEEKPNPYGGMGMGMGGMGGGGMGMGGGGMGMGGGGMGMGGGMSGAPQGATEPDVESQNQLKQIVLAAHNYDSANQCLPGNVSDADGKSLLSWRVSILQFMDEPEQQLYKKFNLDESWDSKHNIQLLNEMPDVFKNADSSSSTKTVYLGFEGKRTMFEPGKKVTFGDIIDGSSNTVFAAQMNQQSAIEWTKPADIPFELATPVSQLAETRKGNVVIAFADGSVQKLSLDDMEALDLANLIQRDDGNVVQISR